MTKRIVASIFWGFYERAEIRLIDNHFQGDVDAIELGASSGIVSATIVSKFANSERRYIGVEANDQLKEIWARNASRYNKAGVALTLRNAAVHYGANSVGFRISRNPTSSAIAEKRDSQYSIEIPAVQLSDIIVSERIESYALFCDIEGAEAAIFSEEEECLRKCKHLFIELHETAYQNIHYSVNDLKMMIEAKGFKCIEQCGAAFYFQPLEEK